MIMGTIQIYLLIPKVSQRSDGRTSRRRSANCRHFSLNLLSYNYDTLLGKTASNASSLSNLYRIILIYSVYLCVI